MSNTFSYQTFQYVKAKKYWEKRMRIHFRGNGIGSSITVGRKGEKVQLGLTKRRDREEHREGRGN